MGGRVGLKGTDDAVDEAVRRGGKAIAPGRAAEMLKALAGRTEANSIQWVTCSGPMGQDALSAEGMAAEIVYAQTGTTSAEDTKRAVRSFLDHKADLIVFVGGDGTARDVVSVAGLAVPIVGVPAGVKMHSAVFGHHPESVAAILGDFVNGATATVEVEVLDLDENRYRRGQWVLRMYATAKTLHEPTLIQVGKMMFEEVSEVEIRDAIEAHVLEEMEESPDTLYVLGPGGTIHGLKERLGGGTLLGVDAAMGKTLIGRDLDEVGILRLLDAHTVAKLIVSPIGAQGFILGRGNAPLSPDVVRRIGASNLVVVATPDKLRHTPELRVDTGDADLDRTLAERGYLFVVQGYREMKVHPIRA